MKNYFDQVYEAKGYAPDPIWITELLRRLSWGDFCIMFYVHIYNHARHPDHTATLDYYTRKDGVYIALERRMIAWLRARRQKMHFFKIMYWMKESLFTEPCVYDIDSYTHFLDQLTAGVIRFDRFISGTYKKDILWEYLDNFILGILINCRSFGEDPDVREVATAEIHFVGEATPLYQIDPQSRIIDSDYEVVIDPADRWAVKNYTQERFIYRGVPVINHIVDVEQMPQAPP